MLNTPAKRYRVALYARVSTDDDRQDLENQIRDLKKYASDREWKIFETFTDKVSGTKRSRPGLDAMLTAASIRQFDVVLVWDLSRLTRDGPFSAFKIVERLKNSGVEFYSYREEFFRTTGPTGDLMFAMFAWFAQFEREQIRARVQAGMNRARADGIHVGRPPSIYPFTAEDLRGLRAAGWSLRKLAAKYHVSRATIERTLNQDESKREIERTEEKTQRSGSRKEESPTAAAGADASSSAAATDENSDETSD